MVPFRSSGWRPGLYFAVGSYYDQVSPQGKVYCELIVSSNYGANWTRLAPHKQFIPLGNGTNGAPGSSNASSWDSHTCYAANGLLINEGEEGKEGEENGKQLAARFYYAGGDGPHSGSKVAGRSNSIGLATSHNVNALAGITLAMTQQPHQQRRNPDDDGDSHKTEEDPADYAGGAIIYTQALEVPSNATRLWLLASSPTTVEPPAISIAVLLPSESTDYHSDDTADDDSDELAGATAALSQLIPWHSRHSHDGLQHKDNSQPGAADALLTAAAAVAADESAAVAGGGAGGEGADVMINRPQRWEVRWSGQPFATAGAGVADNAIDGDGVRLKMTVSRPGDILFAIGWS